MRVFDHVTVCSSHIASALIHVPVFIFNNADWLVDVLTFLRPTAHPLSSIKYNLLIISIMNACTQPCLLTIWSGSGGLGLLLGSDLMYTSLFSCDSQSWSQNTRISELHRPQVLVWYLQLDEFFYILSVTQEFVCLTWDVFNQSSSRYPSYPLRGGPLVSLTPLSLVAP